MIPLWGVEFLEVFCGQRVSIQLWTGHYLSQGISCLATDTRVARPVRRCRAIGLYQHVNMVALRYSHNWSAALYCHGASVAREDVCSNQSHTLKFTYK